MRSQIVSSKNLNTNLEPETISKIIHRIGHDIGNPLTSIISLSSIIEKFSDPAFSNIEPSKLASYAGTISSEAWKISRLSETLVQTFSRRTIQVQPVVIEDIIDRALAKAEGQFSKYPDIEIELDIEEELKGLADGDQLTFALTELIRNSFQANIEYETKLITIEAQRVGEYCKITCSNAIPAELEIDTNQLFQPLVSYLKKVTTPGIGLFTVACIIKRSEGYCEIELSDQFKTSIYLKCPS